VFHFLTESTMTGVIVVEGGEARYVNGSACGLLGYSKKEMLSLSPWWQIIHPDDRPAVWLENGLTSETKRTVRAIRRDGRTIWLTTRIYPMEQQEEGGVFVLHFFDITEHIEMESQLKERALRDPLTGLLNRSYFEDAIQTELERSKRYKRPLTLMMADLRRFKEVNDRLGHQEGDRILSGISSVLRSHLRDSDWVVRYGGDEFLFVLPETGDGVEALEARLHKAVEAWSDENVDGVPVSVDLGWATWTPDRERGIAEILREADAKLYEKKIGR
jgi:diguanylate cyclase (GGDEF)-like protein/PAS domain S-box-containing protein